MMVEDNKRKMNQEPVSAAVLRNESKETADGMLKAQAHNIGTSDTLTVDNNASREKKEASKDRPNNDQDMDHQPAAAATIRPPRRSLHKAGSSNTLALLQSLRERQDGMMDSQKLIIVTQELMELENYVSSNTSDIRGMPTPNNNTETPSQSVTSRPGAVRVSGIGASPGGEEEPIYDPTVPFATPPPNDRAEDLVVAAEVAPDVENLERSIVMRVTEELRKETEYNTPVAEIVDQKQRRRKQMGAMMCVVMVAVAIGLGLALGLPSNSSSGQEPHIRSNADLPPNSTVIAAIPETICYERLPTMGFSEHCGPQERGGGVNNLLAESRLWNVPRAELSLSNAAESRKDLVEGNFTVEMARYLLPFGDDHLVLVNITGARLITAMERGIQKNFDDHALEESSKSMGSYPYTAGLRFSVNMSQPIFQRMYNVEVNPQRQDDGIRSLQQEDGWEPINMTYTYSVVTNSYLANGGDSYHELSYDVADLGVPVLLSFVDYCQNMTTLLNQPLDEYSTQTYIHDPSLDCRHPACLP